LLSIYYVVTVHSEECGKCISKAATQSTYNNTDTGTHVLLSIF